MRLGSVGFWTFVLASIAVGSAAASERQGFGDWLTALRTEALSSGVSVETLDAALDDVQPIDRVIKLDRHQPESSITFEQYLDRTINDARVRSGKQRLRKHAGLLAKLRAEYGVQPRFVVALWGIESDYGRRTGGFEVIDALATLAFDGRRAGFFRRELLEALLILEEGHVEPDKMQGSWAGAMGQPQFMPSTFRQYAVDFDGDSRRDIWNSTGDALASAANYLGKYGWHDDQTWGRRVRVPSGFAKELAGLRVVKKIGEWQALGVRRADGQDLPERELDASIVQPAGPSGPSFLVYDNYRTIMRWNRSDYFATAVGILSDRLR